MPKDPVIQNLGGSMSVPDTTQSPAPALPISDAERISSAALAFVKAHEEDYHECLGSTSLDIDVEFMELAHIAHEAVGCQEPSIAQMFAETPQPVSSDVESLDVAGGKSAE